MVLWLPECGPNQPPPTTFAAVLAAAADLDFALLEITPLSGPTCWSIVEDPVESHQLPAVKRIFKHFEHHHETLQDSVLLTIGGAAALMWARSLNPLVRGLKCWGVHMYGVILSTPPPPQPWLL